MTQLGPIYLSDDEVVSLSLDPAVVRGYIRKAFEMCAAGALRREPKTSIVVAPGHAFQSLCAINTETGFAAVKWVGMVPSSSEAPVNINAHILLSDLRTGELKCLLEARHATALRTAAMSAVAATHLAKSSSRTIGFVGAGVQAESHLLALRDVLPNLDAVFVTSRSKSSAERLCETARGMGLIATSRTARETVSESDVIVTTVPVATGFEPFIDAAWLRSGALVIAVDLARSWLHSSLEQFDVTIVDEEGMRTYAKPGNLVPSLQHAEATLLELVTGHHPGRNTGETMLYVSSGSAVADLAIAELVFATAREAGVGRPM
jgi:ornithine cyclodeaminase/alanine dehydrogenase